MCNLKVIFLDIDGVLWNEDRGYLKDSMDAVGHITDATGAVIVIISGWKSEYAPNHIVDLLKKNGATWYGRIIGYTQESTSRDNEILQWLITVANVDKFVVLDDSFDYSVPNFIHVNPIWGLTLVQAKRAVQILGG